MSYCRWSSGDVYMFHNVGGYIECCVCSLHDEGFKFETKWDIWRGKEYIHMMTSPHTPFFHRLQPRLYQQKYKFYYKGKIELSQSEKERRKHLNGDSIQKQDMKELYQGSDPYKKLFKVGRWADRPVHFRKRSDALNHLLLHRAKGDIVPQYAIDKIKEEIKRMGDITY